MLRLMPTHRMRAGFFPELDEHLRGPWFLNGLTDINTLPEYIDNWRDNFFGQMPIHPFEPAFTSALYYHQYAGDQAFDLSRNGGQERFLIILQTVLFMDDLRADERDRLLRVVCHDLQLVDEISSALTTLLRFHRNLLHERAQLRFDLECLQTRLEEWCGIKNIDDETRVVEWVVREMGDPCVTLQEDGKPWYHADYSVR